jgi:3-deoxy-D-manno-octulosonate 8-phosphate phosphatase (KDO 8-P phosphatase)
MAGLLALAAGVRLAVFDVDGVLTDGRLWLSSDGAELKAFNVRDGHGIKRLLAAGVEVAIISGRASPAVDRRMAELGVRRVVQGCDDKAAALRLLLADTGIEAGQAAYLGDDLPDLPAMRTAGLPAAVGDALSEVRAASVWTSSLPGGHGAAREFCELLLRGR